MNSNKYNNDDQSESGSTIQLEFCESVVQNACENNSNYYVSLQQYYSRKRCATREIIDEETDINKKLRNNDDHFAFTKNNRRQQIVSLSESDESQHIPTDSDEQQGNGTIVF
jgi:hypothetical protein